MGTERVRTPGPGLCKKILFEVSLNRKTTAATHSVCVRLGHQVDHGQTEAGGHEGLDVILHEVDHAGLAEVGGDAGQHLGAWQVS